MAMVSRRTAHPVSVLTLATIAEWVTVNAVKTMQEIVARASNRAFVGLPVCTSSFLLLAQNFRGLPVMTGRNQEFLDLAIAFTITVIKDRFIINLVPKPLKT